MRHHAPRGATDIIFLTMMTSIALAVPAAAKDVRIQPHTTANAAAAPDETAEPEFTLDFDAIALATSASASSADTPAPAPARGLDLHRSENPDGSSTVAVAHSLSRDGSIKTGADFNLAPKPRATYEPGEPLPTTAKDHAAGTAWASLGVTRFATVDTRIDPGSEQGTLGATIEHSVPLGDELSVTLRGRYTVSDRLTVPAERDPAAPVVSNDQNVRLNIGSTGTTLAAGVSANSVDPVPHNTLSADQKIYGPLHVTTAVTDAGQPTSNKSVTARFELNW